MIDQPTWRSVLVSYAAMAAIPLSLWAVSRPLAAVAVLAAAAALFVGVRRAPGLARCYRECRGIAFDLGGTVRVTIAWEPTRDPA
ncbi:hypothetical protein HUG12_07980 [Halorarum salinum]|uniref:Uncharacterized protein n=1 Tax=Halorarum salinum TaxID=2743089 RepID=A0A7D5LA62_9EURY|nr:hypothetical protein HUG12_07980 [Halobaculum salinum]